MSTQSGDDAKPPSALATLYLEDGSKFVGRSFGSHEAAVDGEVRKRMQLCFLLISLLLTRVLIYSLNNKFTHFYAHLVSGCFYHWNGRLS